MDLPRHCWTKVVTYFLMADFYFSELRLNRSLRFGLTCLHFGTGDEFFAAVLASPGVMHFAIRRQHAALGSGGQLATTWARDPTEIGMMLKGQCVRMHKRKSMHASSPSDGNTMSLLWRLSTPILTRPMHSARASKKRAQKRTGRGSRR
jgi:hypothetical protein